jgi:hypothetical protein
MATTSAKQMRICPSPSPDRFEFQYPTRSYVLFFNIVHNSEELCEEPTQSLVNAILQRFNVQRWIQYAPSLSNFLARLVLLYAEISDRFYGCTGYSTRFHHTAGKFIDMLACVHC